MNVLDWLQPLRNCAEINCRIGIESVFAVE